MNFPLKPRLRNAMFVIALSVSVCEHWESITAVKSNSDVSSGITDYDSYVVNAVQYKVLDV